MGLNYGNLKLLTQAGLLVPRRIHANLTRTAATASTTTTRIEVDVADLGIGLFGSCERLIVPIAVKCTLVPALHIILILARRFIPLLGCRKCSTFTLFIVNSGQIRITDSLWLTV